jgi:DNA-directed RNA polymerase specialized sigma24 family protein
VIHTLKTKTFSRSYSETTAIAKDPSITAAGPGGPWRLRRGPGPQGVHPTRSLVPVWPGRFTCRLVWLSFAMADSEPADINAALMAQRNVFKSFLVARVGNDAAEDLLQSGLVRAMQRSGEIKDGAKAVAWLYQLLRNLLVDHVRSRAAAAKREALWATDLLAPEAHPELEQEICACFEKLLLSLKPMQAELLRRVELGGENRRPSGSRARDDAQLRERCLASGTPRVAREADRSLRRLRLPCMMATATERTPSGSGGENPETMAQPRERARPGFVYPDGGGVKPRFTGVAGNAGRGRCVEGTSVPTGVIVSPLTHILPSPATKKP